MNNYFDFLPDDKIVSIALSLSRSEINNLCQTSYRFNEAICNNNYFWYLKFINDFDEPDIEDIRLIDWKQLYYNYRTVLSFGLNKNGQLGIGNYKNTSIPTEVSNIRAQYVTCGQNSTIVIDMKNNVWLIKSPSM